LAFACTYLSVPEPEAFIFPIDSFSIGLGLAAAIGASAGRPDWLTVLSIGDGGLMMTLGELHTAVRLRLPLLVIVCNDSAFGSEMHMLRVLGANDEVATYSNPSFESLALSLGARAMTVTTLADLDRLPTELQTLDGPLLLDCHVSRDVQAEWVATFLAMNKH
jgi:thiamine pyrophosphate-dependent acetolactate synthase large subunit-like protein